MTTTTIRDEPRLVAPPRLIAAGIRANLLETVRVPMAVIGSVAFPALALLFFVVPQGAVRDDPSAATQSVIAMGVFAIMVGNLFSFGLTIAEAREKPWEPFVRSLPAGGGVRIIAHILSTGVVSLVSLLPLIVIGALLTSAEASPTGILFGLVAAAVTSLPFMLMGIAIGYAMSMKVALAVIQILFFALAFGGGLFLPPFLFPEWLDVLSKGLPSRQAREIVIWAVEGGTLAPWAWIGMLAWIVVLAVAALLLYRRDEGRRYR